jgi:Protein of unknown function (DUF1570)
MFESRFRRQIITLAATCTTALAVSHKRSPAADALHRVTFTDSTKNEQTIDGRIVVKAQDGGLLLEARDGVLWSVTPQQLKRNEKATTEFTPFTARETAARLKAEFGEGFAVITSRHYVLCSNTGKYYSQWCRALFERLLTAFYKHWDSSKLNLKPPAAPLVVIVFADRKQYARYATNDAGPSMAETIGYFSARTNRVALFDLTASPGARPARSLAEVRRKVVKVPFNVATVVHEATHQIAFNSGLQTRYADNPLWLSEGLAMYFETPDLRNPKGWRTVGRVNPFRLRQLRDYLKSRRKPGSLATLTTTDNRLTDGKSLPDAYAEAWALTYFLIKTHRKEFEKYLAVISRKGPLVFGTAADRKKEFEQAFGETGKLEAEFLRYLSNPRLR